ncbi:Arylsulfatase A [Arboricoccus pini]|uniref:Arylsulfatase A n=1 Tax=Arboricoccus pini TaxID=1963835 RepID=A0A212S0R3_9PROT|nr:alkaline phosphatase family protein [Arboricoccus pini]SNB78669.1 Arylsulfatase A [Arboricoccus pini]
MADNAPLNILLITADQWRGDLMRLAGPFPALEGLAAEGVTFERHFNQAYPCGPARASLWTGLYAHKHRSIQNGTPLDARHPTLFQLLRGAGYQPRLFGYTDTTLDPRGRPPADPDLGNYENIAPGILPEMLLNEAAAPWLAHLRRAGYPPTDPDAGRGGVFDRAPFPAPAIYDARDSETAFLADRFIDWLAVAGATPWCAHLSFIAPHPPFVAPEPFDRLVDPASLPPPIGAAGHAAERLQHPLLAWLLERIDIANFVPGLSGPAADIDADTVARIRAVYAGLAREVDRNLGRIFQALRQQGRWERTLIVFTADHGEQLFDHGLLGKTAYFDQSAHIPLILRDPRAAADPGRGRRVEAFSEAIDLLPTLLSASGLAAPRNADGRDLSPWIRGETPKAWRDAVFWAHDFRDLAGRAAETAFGLPSEWCNLSVVRTEKLKYVHFAGLPPVLFDLVADPMETVNRAADPKARELRIEGMERLLTWRQRAEERTLTGLMARGGRLYEDQDDATRDMGLA